MVERRQWLVSECVDEVHHCVEVRAEGCKVGAIVRDKGSVSLELMVTSADQPTTLDGTGAVQLAGNDAGDGARLGGGGGERRIIRRR